jgi:hypothetical protein
VVNGENDQRIAAPIRHIFCNAKTTLAVGVSAAACLFCQTNALLSSFISFVVTDDDKNKQAFGVRTMKIRPTATDNTGALRRTATTYKTK